MLKGWPWVRVAILEVISDTLSHPDSDKAETMDLRQNVIESIRTLAKRNGVCKVILFGSRARGDNSARSDIDLAASGGNVAKFALDDDEEGRPDALESRNLMSHAHDDRVAPSIISKTREKYIFVFQEMERELRESWSLEE